jgi:hypothetical protein
MPLWMLITLLLLIALAFGANWLFRQRSPEEIIAARERLRRWKRR